MSVEQTDDVSQSGEAPHVRTTMTGESRDAEIAVSPPKRRRRTLTTTLAFAFLLAVLVGVAMYAYAKPGEGLGALLGQATVPLFVLALLAWRAHVRWDVGLVVVALFLIWMNRNEILETYDARRLLSEIGSASSPTDYLKGLQSSKSRFAEQIRAVLASANEANDKVSAVFAELNDPSLTNALTPANITDPDKVRRSQQTLKQMPRSHARRCSGLTVFWPMN